MVVTDTAAGQSDSKCMCLYLLEVHSRVHRALERTSRLQITPELHLVPSEQKLYGKKRTR